MAEASAQLVMALRRLTDLPVRECQAALREHGGDIGRAVGWMLAHRWFADPPAEVWSRLRRELAAGGISGVELPE